MEIQRLPVLRDNYVFLLVDRPSAAAAVVDPAVAEPVIAALEAQQLQLSVVLQTHHHHDHIGGTPELLSRWPGAQVWAAASDRARIPFQTDGLRAGDERTLFARPVQVLEVPGHTLDHIAFFFPASGTDGPELFCGDALFAGGCGRIFEGTPVQMLCSLDQLSALPEATRIWCAHEYTEANLRFAVTQEPDNQALQERFQSVQVQRSAGEATVPSSVALERATNPFLRCREESLQQASGCHDPALVLAEIRRRKDVF